VYKPGVQGLNPITLKEDAFMHPVQPQTLIELDINIEELEPKVAPDGGETVLPLPKTHHHH
jgi:hypothetical protein